MQGNLYMGEGHYTASTVVNQIYNQLLNKTKQKVNNYHINLSHSWLTTAHAVQWPSHQAGPKNRNEWAKIILLPQDQNITREPKTGGQ